MIYLNIKDYKPSKLDKLSKKTVLFPLARIKNKQHLRLDGQVLKLNPEHLNYSDYDDSYKNVVRMLRSYFNLSVPDGKFKVEVGKEAWEVQIDSRGYFTEEIDIPSDHDDIEFTFEDGEHEKKHLHIPAIARNFPSTEPDFSLGLITDIDDTIMISHTSFPLKKIRYLLTKSASKRHEVPGMGQLYTKLGKLGMHFFYLSNSEMNLYLLMKHFLDINNYPQGALFLQKYLKFKDFITPKSRISKEVHKSSHIHYLYDVYPNAKYILVGDNTQKDPFIYLNIAKKYPGKTLAVCIRTVKDRDERMKIDFEKLNVPFFYFSTGHELEENLKGLLKINEWREI